MSKRAQILAYGLIATLATACGGDAEVTDPTTSGSGSPTTSAPVAKLSPDEQAFNDGRQAYNDKQFDKAEKLLTPLSDKGNLEATYYLYETYNYYDNPKRDKAKALALLEKAASKGHISSAHMLGSHYLDIRKYDKALPWIKMAAEHCTPDGILFYANMFRDGDGVTKDPIKAFQWYTISEIKSGSNDVLKQWKKDLKLSDADQAKATTAAKAFKCLAPK